MPKPEWTKYKVKETNSGSLDQIYHVSHISSALNIVADRKIKAGLVYDESKLNKTRTLVCWLSPNDWEGNNGFRYGNIRFAFNWKKICEDMKPYWVEVMQYGRHAPRILLSEQNHSPRLQVYDPKKGYGPWFYNKTDDQHYWNRDICLEIMIEGDLHLSNVLEIDFVNHHPQYCCISGNCEDKRLHKDEAGAKFIAGMISREIYYYRRMPKFYELKDERKKPKSFFQYSCNCIWQFFKDINHGAGRVIHTDNQAPALARAVLGAYANSNFDEAEHLSMLFRSTKDLKKSCAKLIAITFKFDDYKDLLPVPRKK